LNQPSSPAFQSPAKRGLLPQGRQGAGIGDAQAPQRGVHGGARPSDFAETELQAMVGQGLELRADLCGGDALGDGLHRQECSVGRQGRHCKGHGTQTAQQACSGQRHGLGVSCLEEGGSLAVTLEKIQEETLPENHVKPALVLCSLPACPRTISLYVLLEVEPWKER